MPHDDFPQHNPREPLHPFQAIANSLDSIAFTLGRILVAQASMDERLRALEKRASKGATPEELDLIRKELAENKAIIDKAKKTP